MNLLTMKTLCAFFGSGLADPKFTYLTSYDSQGRIMKRDDIEKNSVNVLKPIVFIIGEPETEADVEINELISAFLRKQIHNVFKVGLSKNSENGTEKISDSKEIADFINTIYSKTEEKYLHIRLVGLAAGFSVAVGAAVGISDAQGGRKVDRITGIDPPYPANENGGPPSPSSQGRYEENANLVDVVHSNLLKFDGRLVRLGHVDFYVDDEICDQVKDKGCGRLDAIKLYTKSINSENLRAVKCSSAEDYKNKKCDKNDQILFGENLPSNAEGTYIVKKIGRAHV